MKLNAATFDLALATGEIRRKQRSPWSKPDLFGVQSLKAPTPADYNSLDEAVESLRQASQTAKTPC